MQHQQQHLQRRGAFSSAQPGPVARFVVQRHGTTSRRVSRLLVAEAGRELTPSASIGSVEGTIEGLRTVVVTTGIEAPRPKERTFSNANFPIDAEGRSLHLGTKRGEVANRILSVGSMDRALMVADLLEPPRPGAALFQHLSGRGFLTITGRYKGVPVSVVTTLMGMANMDFVVRECRAVVDGQMAVVRLGTCGALRPPASLGDLLIASDGAICLRRDPDAWTLGDGRERYAVSAAVRPDPLLSELLAKACEAEVGPAKVVRGLNATADGFYGSQGRTGGPFDDDNEDLITSLLERRPELISLEMETFMLLHLAACSGGSVVGAAFCIALAERYSNRFLEANILREREQQGGRAALAALIAMPLRDDASTDATIAAAPAAGRPVGGYVWEGGYVETSLAAEDEEEGLPAANGSNGNGAAKGKTNSHGPEAGGELLKSELRRIAAARERKR